MGILDAPARTQRQQYNAAMSLQERLNTEGRPYSSGTFIEAATWTTDGSVSAGFTAPGLTQAWYVDTITVTCSKNARVQIEFNVTGLGGNDEFLWQVQTSPGIPIVLKIGQIVRPAVTTFSTGSAGQVKIRNVYDTDKTGTNLMAYAAGWRLTDDLDYSAEKVYLHLGDSITGPGTGIVTKADEYDWKTLEYFRAQGSSVRMLNMSVSGSASTLHESRRSLGAYNFPQADLIGYSLGTNDAGQLIPTATYKTNVKNMIAWKQARYPNAKMIVYGVTPRENNTVETACALLRTAASQAVTEAADSKVFFCDLGSSFDRTVTTNYATTDTAGDRTHPSVVGHTAVFSVISAFLTANNIKP